MNQTFSLHWGLHALLKLLRDYRFETVLDVGSGTGEHARFLRLFDKKVSTCNLFPPADWVGDFLKARIKGAFDVVWCSHMLEHQRNPGLVLDKIYSLLNPSGILVLCLPQHPATRLVPGHLSTWSLSLACQHLVQAGFDCRNISAFSSYELSLIVRKPKEKLPRAETEPSFEYVKKYLPSPLEIGGEGEVAFLNWENPLHYPLASKKPLTRLSIQSKNLDSFPLLRPAVVIEEVPFNEKALECSCKERRASYRATNYFRSIWNGITKS